MFGALNEHVVSLQQINQMIADVDKDGSGAIDFDEFAHMMTAKIGERDTKEELMKAFQLIDLDRNVLFCLLNVKFVSVVGSTSNTCIVLICHYLIPFFPHLNSGKDICCRH